MFQRCVVVGGGAVGGMFADLLAGSGSDTLVVDVAPTARGGTRRLVADITRPCAATTSAIGRADLVLLAVDEPVALAAVAPVTARMRPGALLADTLSVKTRMADAVAVDGNGVSHVGLNPMFAPDAGMAGRPVAAVVTRDGPAVAALLDLVERWGGRVVRCTAQEHDQTTAATQVLSHAVILSFGLALRRLGVDVARLAAVAPPPHLTLLALTARVVGGRAAVYEDIQQANPFAPTARQALADAVAALTDLVDDTGTGLDGVFDDLRQLMGAGLTEHQTRCREIFRNIHQTYGGEPKP